MYRIYLTHIQQKFERRNNKLANDCYKMMNKDNIDCFGNIPDNIDTISR